MEALVLTIILEVAALALLKEKDPVFYLYWICITTITNIPANILASPAFSAERWVLYLTVLTIEAAVFVSEALMCYIYKRDRRQAIKYSAICNAASFLIGSVISLIF